MNEETVNEQEPSSAQSGGQTASATQADAPQTPAPDSAQPHVSTDSVCIEQPTDTPTVQIDPAEPSAAGAAPEIRIAVSALSDIGCVRKNNEDYYGYDESLGIYVVCDGMGGMASGEVASSRTVEAILSSFAASAAAGGAVSARLLHAINTANLDVWEYLQIPSNRGMGTTVVAR